MPLSFNGQLEAARDALDKFADWNFSGEIPVERRDESGVLAFTLNRLAKFYGTIAVLSNKRFARLVQTGNIPPVNQNKQITALFCNIRSFSPLMRDLRLREKQDILNTFFQKAGLCAQLTGGCFDKIVGDKALFHWGMFNEGDVRDNALNAVRAVLMMRACLGDWNEKRIAAGLSPVLFSFGMNTGTASLSSFCIGGISEYSVTGQAVDGAYHGMLQTKAAKTEINMTTAMYDLIAKFIIADEITPSAGEKSREADTRFFTLINIREKAATTRLLKDLARIADIDMAVAATFAGPRGPKTLPELRAILHIPEV